MAKYQVFCEATAFKFLGEVEAENKDQAYQLAWEKFKDEAGISVNVHNDFEVGDGDIVVEVS